MKRKLKVCIFPLLVIEILFLLTISCEKDDQSSDISFNPNKAYGTVVDIDGNSYKTISIGTQVWMAENLNTTKYNDGTSIPKVIDRLAWRALTTGAYANYNNNEENSTTYGKLYNYYTVVDSCKLCPTGWHIPTDAEWAILISYSGGEIVAGSKLKEIGTKHWNAPNSGADNTTGFTALPGGYRNNNGEFCPTGYIGYWWSSIGEYDHAWSRFMSADNSYGFSDYSLKSCGFSVRCVRD